MAKYKFYRNPSPESEGDYALRGTEKPNCIFLAEGATEALFLEKWLDELSCNPTEIAVICFGGLKVGVVLKRLAQDENFDLVQRFGLFLDAESGTAAQRADAVSGALRNVSVIPKNHNLTPGVVSNIGGKRVVLFVSPDNTNSGYIEHTVMNEIASTPLSICIDSLRQCAEGVLGNSVSPKALVQTYLGIRKAGLCGTGRGFEKGVLAVMHDAYAQVRNTLGGVL